MLSASSPVIYPASSSPPPPAKRPNPYREQPKPRPRGNAAGFLIDDDSDEEEDGLAQQPAAKRRMLSSPSEDIVTANSTQPSSPPAIPLDAEVVEPSEAKSQGSVPNITQGPNDGNGLYGNVTFDQLLSAHRDSTTTAQQQPMPKQRSNAPFQIKTCAGRTVDVKVRKPVATPSYENMVAARSKTKEGRAKRAYYGIHVHELVSAAKQEMEASKTISEAITPDQPMPSVEALQTSKKSKKSLLWTEKYRAKNFIDLCGDDGTNRNVLRWLKRWDPLVFPGASKHRPSGRRAPPVEEEKPHRKILMLTGPPGLGKTTLAHVCAKQAGYEVLEINASDDRSKDVVKNQIRTSLGTESVKTVQHSKAEPGQQQQPKVARPVCVVVDEVDGVVSGSGGAGDGGFIKALMDLITLGEKNSSGQAAQQSNRKQRKTDDFRQMRPLILICNDVYHSSLRPLRQSSLAEVIHVGKPSIDAVVSRLKSVFEKEGIPCEKDAARKLCESAWGMSTGMDARKGAQSNAEGDLRGIMVVGEWVAGRLRAASLKGQLRLTRHWLEQNIVQGLSHGGGGARGLGRGNTKDIVTRVFQEGAGFPKGTLAISNMAAPLGEQPQAQLKFSEQAKKYAMERLREMVETSGDVDRVITEVFSEYPSHELNDDFFLTKPSEAYEWMHFHDACSSRLFGNQDWELAPYLCQPVLACHHLFATPTRHSEMMYQKRGQDEEEAAPLPFSGPRADFSAREAEKENRALLQTIQAQLSPTMVRSFRSAEDIATDFIPYLARLVSPEVKPVVVGGSGDQKGTASVRRESEKLMVKRAAETLLDVGIALQRGKIEGDAFSRPVWVYRMDPDIDTLSTFETSAAVVHGTQAPVRYAVRQVLDQEMLKVASLRENSARQARFRAGNLDDPAEFMFNDDKENNSKLPTGPILPIIPPKRDFFGRIIKAEPRPLQETDGNGVKGSREASVPEQGEQKVWVTFHEGMNNAVRKPLTLDELLRGL